MMARFLHTADWQLGKRFGSVSDPSKREILRSARFQAIDRVAAAAREHKVDFVLVAGDLFDSPTVSRDIVSRALAGIGRIPVPVLAIPGNHDHAGPGSLWEQPHFLAERDSLAPNFVIFDKAQPHVIGGAVILPCPLLRRQSTTHPLAWIPQSMPEGVRIVLAHGTIQEFGAQREEDEGPPNFLDLSMIEDIDYVALGDWHGTKQVGPRAWYSGAIEADRFPRSEEYVSGQVLLVELGGALPVVTPLPTGSIAWHDIVHDFQGPDACAEFHSRLEELLGQRSHADAIRLTLTGSLSLEDDARLDAILELYDARCLRCEVRERPAIQPSAQEIQSLTARPGDPLIAAVAARLQSAADPVNIEALRHLFACVRQLEGGE